MPNTTFGSPGAGDEVSFLEIDIERAAQASVAAIKDFKKLRPRPPGTTPVSNEDRHFDWMLRRDDPAYWGEELSMMQIHGYSLPEAILELMAFDRKQQKKHAGMSDEAESEHVAEETENAY